MQAIISFQYYLQHLCFVIFHFQPVARTSPCEDCRTPPQTYWLGHSRDFYSAPLAFYMHSSSSLFDFRSFCLCKEDYKDNFVLCLYHITHTFSVIAPHSNR